MVLEQAFIGREVNENFYDSRKLASLREQYNCGDPKFSELDEELLRAFCETRDNESSRLDAYKYYKEFANRIIEIVPHFVPMAPGSGENEFLIYSAKNFEHDLVKCITQKTKCLEMGHHGFPPLFYDFPYVRGDKLNNLENYLKDYLESSLDSSLEIYPLHLILSGNDKICFNIHIPYPIHTIEGYKSGMSKLIEKELLSRRVKKYVYFTTTCLFYTPSERRPNLEGGGLDIDTCLDMMNYLSDRGHISTFTHGNTQIEKGNRITFLGLPKVE